MQCITVVSNGFSFLLPGDYDWRRDGWDGYGQSPELARWPAEFRDRGRSVRCISHHTASPLDPLRFAVESGCTGVKAEIWLHNDDILVGSSVPALTAKNTLQDTYLNPLLRTLKERNPATASKGKGDKPPKGIFEYDTTQSFILLLDFRSTADALWPRLVSQLGSLRDMGYLTHFSGSEVVQRPVTVVVTGRVPFDLIRASRNHRDIFFDASMDEIALNDINNLADVFKSSRPSLHRREEEVQAGASPQTSESGKSDDASKAQNADRPAAREPAKNPPATSYRYNAHNSYCASTNFKESIGRPHRGRFSPQQIELIRAQVRAAHKRGLKARYHGIPSWPGKLRDLVWHTLVAEGVDLIEVDWIGDQNPRRGWRRRLLALGDDHRRPYEREFIEFWSSGKG